MRLVRYSYKIQHVAGKQFYTPDTLSRYPVGAADEKDELNISEIEVFESQFMAEFPATRIQEVLRTQMADTTYKELKKTCAGKMALETICSTSFMPGHWSVQGELSIIRGLLMKGTTLVIQTALRKGMLTKIQIGHMGTKKCIERV
ncbi:hypothetical protein PR048_017428 [Dryococelus australis]|uniref:Uncharacterized protein n=1 Tax=Dryococelus australis TaxID=614101 RepID=A0ABQ9H9K3_9NEOP|nr:hypothetical protein PR048_017428 [Dryococelus australis]